MTINEVKIENQLNKSMMEMSAYILLQRAIPDLRDGLKPVQRRIIYSMVLNNTVNFTKSATVEGRVMQLHPHGGSYDSMVKLVQKDIQNLPYLVGKGSWGQYTSADHEAAASRYTEVKLGKNAIEITKELKEKSVKLVPNFDGTIMVPEVLPVTYPTILTHALSGVAIAFASSTFSYNPLEILDNVKNYFKSRKIKTLYPDFPTGASIIENKENVNEIFKTGSGSLRMRAKIEILENKLIVHQIPYGINREAIIEKIVKLNKNGLLKQISGIRDGTSFKGMKIVINLKKNTNKEELIEELYKRTQLESSINANMNILLDGRPQVLGVDKILIEWIKWRKSIIHSGLVKNAEKMDKELNILNGLKKIVKNESISNIIDIIRYGEDNKIISMMMKTHDLNEEQAEYISKITLRSLNYERLSKKIEEINNLEKQIKLLYKNLKDENFIEKELVERMENTFKVIGAEGRKTDIIKVTEKTVVKKVKKSSIDDKKVFIALTEKGLLLKSSTDKFDNLIVGDKIIKIMKTNNNKRVTVFLNNKQVLNIKVNTIEESGTFIEDFVDVFVEDENKKFIVLGFNNGYILKINFNEFVKSTSVLKKGYYNDADLVFIEQTNGDKKLILTVKSEDRVKKIKLDKVPEKSNRTSKGSLAIKGTNVTFKLH